MTQVHESSPGASAPTDALVARVRAWLIEHRFTPGEKVGTERAMAEAFGVGRTVLRGVLDELEREGIVRRVLGRGGGIFAHDGKIQRHLNTIQGVPTMIRAQGMTLATRVLRSHIAYPEPDEARALGISKNESVTRILRARHVDGVSWSIERSVLPTARFPGLAGRDVSGSLYDLLSSEYRLDLGRADETVEAMPASAEFARVLGIEPESALFRIRRRSVDVHDEPVEYATDYFRADRTRIHLQRYGSNWKRAR